MASDSTRFGAWPSAVSPQLVAAGGTRFDGPASRPTEDGQGTEIWWLESRPSDGGRSVLIRQVGEEAPSDMLAAPWSARTSVHEYGGGAWWLGTSNVYFVHWEDQRLYRFAPGEAEPEAITAAPTLERGWRYADGVEHPDGKNVVCVREDHHETEQNAEPRNEIVAVPTAGGSATVLVSGPDFVSSPRISPDGRWLSWVEWDHPNMPWDQTRLVAAPLFESDADVRLGNKQVIADGAAIHGASWGSDGRLIYSTDESGFWNLAWWTAGTGGSLTELEDSEIGAPCWQFGTQQWTELDDGRLAVVVTAEAADSLAVVNSDGSLVPIHDGPLSVSGMTAGPGGSLAVLYTDPMSLAAVALIETTAPFERRPIRIADDPGVETTTFSSAETVWFESNQRRTHAFFYSPMSSPLADTHGQSDEQLPPLIVVGHGGPTAHATSSLNLKIQYWTTRGFAVVDVNYGGSTGFGRDYRQRLNGQWGVLDVEDCINAALHLASEGLVDGDRMVIRGSSAGGLTVLNALISSDRFAAGVSLYGVADLKALATETHKFESRYLDGMIGPYPEAAEVYEQRSPISHVDKLDAPMLVLQGSEDRVVPPAQSEAIVAALANKGVAHLYLLFDGEQHGFRQAKNIERSLEVELWFYGRVLGFAPDDRIDAPVDAIGL